MVHLRRAVARRTEVHHIGVRADLRRRQVRRDRGWVLLWSMLLARCPIGIDMPVPTSLPGRAPVSGFAPGGTPCAVIVLCASTGVAARAASTATDMVRERIGSLLPAYDIQSLAMPKPRRNCGAALHKANE
jgi:hypothetical protein